MIGAARGYQVRLCVPANVTPERKRILKAFGADVVFTDPMQGSDGAILRVKEMYAEHPDLYFYPDQYNNDGNWRAHYDGRRLKSSSRPAGASRISSPGSARAARSWARAGRLRELNPAIRLISVQPDSPLHGLEGLKHMETAIVPGIYDPALADEDLGVGTEEAFELTRQLARQGLFVGISSGAAPGRRAARGARRLRCRGRGDLPGRWREVPVRALLGRDAPGRERRARDGVTLETGVDARHPRPWRRRRTRTSAAARLSVATAS